MACIKSRRRINALPKMVWAFVASTYVLPACLLLLVINCIIAVKYILIVRNTYSEAQSINAIAANSSTPKAMMLKRCYRLISGAEKLERTVTNPPTDVEFLFRYALYDDCAEVLSNRFGHPPVSEEEKELPIAYSITIYKSARLFERILRAIFMPNNVYCIHIDKKSSELFLAAIKAMIRCLPNVFVATNRTSVLWGHFSLVQAQLNCMEELSQSPDESVYSSLQQHPLAPGGIRGSQPEWIARAFLWRSRDNFLSCKGFWVRDLCWISFQDLQWAIFASFVILRRISRCIEPVSVIKIR